MDLFRTINISASALSAERFRMDVIAENLANANTTRTANGDPYRRRYTVLEERESPKFAKVMEDIWSRDINVYDRSYEIDYSRYYLDGKRKPKDDTGTPSYGKGVRVTKVGEDQSDFRLDYNPEHPDADENGYVRMPNVDTVREMVDLISASRSYQANATTIETFKTMANKALELGR